MHRYCHLGFAEFVLRGLCIYICRVEREEGFRAIYRVERVRSLAVSVFGFGAYG